MFRNAAAHVATQQELGVHGSDGGIAVGHEPTRRLHRIGREADGERLSEHQAVSLTKRRAACEPCRPNVNFRGFRQAGPSFRTSNRQALSQTKVSKWCVRGNMSNACTLSMRRPAASKGLRSRDKVTGSQPTYATARGVRPATPATTSGAPSRGGSSTTKSKRLPSRT